MMKMKGMKHAHGDAGSMAGMSHGGGSESVVKEVAKGTLVSGTIHTGRRLVGKISSNPWVLIGLGFVAGYMVHKHRKGIIRSANRAVDKSKDFVLNQKENLEDIVAEHKESKEES